MFISMQVTEYTILPRVSTIILIYRWQQCTKKCKNNSTENKDLNNEGIKILEKCNASVHEEEH